MHDFALTGSPLLALAATKKLNTHLNVVILSLVKEGKLKDLFVENSSAVFCVSALFDNYQVSEGIIKTLNDEFEFDFSIVNSASANNILFGLSKYNIPAVTLIHEFAQTTESKKVSKCLELSDVCVFSTKSTLDAGLKELGHEPNSKIFVQTQGKITHAEVLGDLNFVTTSETSFNQILDKTKIRVLGVGSLLMTKGVDLFLQIAQLVEERRPNQFQFIWVGSKSELEEKNYGVFIKEFIEKSKSLNNFIFLEQTSELPKLMKEIDAYALTSRLDTFPNVAIEALCLGKPVICFEKTGGIPNYLESLKLEELCIADYLDVSDFATKLIKLVNDQDSLDRFSKEIKVTAESDFDMDLYVKKLLEFGAEAKKLVSLKNG